MFKIYNFIVIKFLFLLFLLLSGCSSNNSDENALNFVNKIKKKPPKIMTTTKSMNFDFKSVPINLKKIKDPFDIHNIETVSDLLKKKRPDALRAKEPLESMDLTDFKMVGTFGKNNDTWALLKAANNKFYRIGVGEYIGKNSGKVQKITDDLMVIKEVVPDGTGGWQSQFVSIFAEKKSDQRK